MEIPSVAAPVDPCRECGHGKADHSHAGLFGCSKAIGLVRCPCWNFLTSEPAPRTPRPGFQFYWCRHCYVVQELRMTGRPTMCYGEFHSQQMNPLDASVAAGECDWNGRPIRRGR